MDLFACSGEVSPATLVWSEIFHNSKAGPSIKNVSSAPVLSAVHNTMLSPHHQAQNSSNENEAANLDQSQSSLNEHDEEENADSSFTGNNSAFASDNVLLTLGSKSDRTDKSESLVSEDFMSHENAPKAKRVSSKNHSSNNSSYSGSKAANGIGPSRSFTQGMVKDDLDLMMKNKPSHRDYRGNLDLMNGNLTVSQILSESGSTNKSIDRGQQGMFRISPAAKEERVFTKTPWIQDGKTYPATVVGLHDEIHDFFNWICPTEAECTMRSEVVKRVRNAVNKVWPLGIVEVYGSYKSGLYLPTSDIDLSIMVNQVSAQDIAKWLSLLERQLKADNVCSENGAKVLPHAVVPIIKLTDRITNVRVDISVNIVNAVNSARLVSEYIRKFPPLPHLVLVLKQFLLQRDLNEVYQGGLSSYSLILMVVSFLQLHPRAEGCKSADVNYGVLLIEFFELYGKNMNYLRAGIRVADGGSYVPRKERQDAPFLSIEDPLDKENDIGRVSWAAQIVKDAFEYAYWTLSRAVTSLTGTQVNSFLSKIIEINEETQDYRRWINDKWKGCVPEDEAPPFAPYFTNYDNNYNPYFFAQTTPNMQNAHHHIVSQSMMPNGAMPHSLAPPRGMLPFHPFFLHHPGTLLPHPNIAAINAPSAYTALSTSANGSSVTEGASKSSSSAQSTASDSENSGNGAEQSSSYSYGSNENSQIHPSVAVTMTSINPINSVVNKRTSELNGIYRNRDEKRQAISAGQSGPNMVTGQQPMPRYLSNNNHSQGNFSMENKPPHQNQERYYNRNRQNQNWSRRQGLLHGGYQQQMGSHNNTLMNLPNGSGGNYGGNRKNRGPHFNRGYVHPANNSSNSNPGQTNYHRSANSPLVMNQQQQTNKLNSSSQNAAIMPGVVFGSNGESGNPIIPTSSYGVNVQMDKQNNMLISNVPVTSHQLMMQQHQQNAAFFNQQYQNQRIPPRHQVHQHQIPTSMSSPLGALNLPLSLGDFPNSGTSNTYTRKTRGAMVTKSDRPENPLTDSTLYTLAQSNCAAPEPLLANGEAAYFALLPQTPQSSSEPPAIGAHGDLPQSNSSLSGNHKTSTNHPNSQAQGHSVISTNLETLSSAGLMASEVALQSAVMNAPLSLNSGLTSLPKSEDTSVVDGCPASASSSSMLNEQSCNPENAQQFTSLHSSVSVPSNMNLNLTSNVNATRSQGQEVVASNTSVERIDSADCSYTNASMMSADEISRESISVQNLFNQAKSATYSSTPTPASNPSKN